MRIQLQRDAMAWDSGGSTKSRKKLTIANIDKLVGVTTGPISNGWVCVKATERSDSYDLIFNFVPGGIAMDVRIVRESQPWTIRHAEGYLIDIRQYLDVMNLRGPIGSHSYTMSKPTVYQVGDGIFGNPKTLASWLDAKLTLKKLETEALIWKNKPWYEKLILTIKDFLPKNVNPKMAPKIDSKHYMKPKKAGA